MRESGDIVAYSLFWERMIKGRIWGAYSSLAVIPPIRGGALITLL